MEPKRLRAGGTGAAQQFAAQQFMPAMQADLHIGFSERKNFGRVGRAHLFEIAQNDHRPVALGQGQNRVFQQDAQFATRRAGLGGG